MTCELASHHSLDQILQTVTSGACEALGCERASLYLYDADRQEVYTRVATDLEIEEIRSPIELGRHRLGGPQPGSGQHSRPRSRTRAGTPPSIKKTGFQTRNILAAPIIAPHEDRLIGVLQLLNKLDGHVRSFRRANDPRVRRACGHGPRAGQLLADEAQRSHELQTAVNMGRRIQQSFLAPPFARKFPDTTLAAWWRPAESVSGDYYDIVPLPDGRLGLVVADVSGHGMGPSLLMASVRAMVHVLARRRVPTRRDRIALAEMIAPDLDDGRFSRFCWWPSIRGTTPIDLLQRRPRTRACSTIARPKSFQVLRARVCRWAF